MSKKDKPPIISDNFQIGPDGAYEHMDNQLDRQYQALLQDILDNHETIEKTITRFINAGVHQTKIIPTESPSVVIWSRTRKCLVGGKGQPDTLEVVDDGNGNLKATYDNNIFISLHNRTELTESDMKEINESEGIVVTNATYGKPYFRFGFIPK